MAKLTLLDITQDILNDISGDEVNSIDDTMESVQAAAIVRSTYFDMMSSRNWPHTKLMIYVSASGNTATPTIMTLPENTKELILINYDKSKDPTLISYEEVKYITPEDFLRVCNKRKNTDSRVVIVSDPTSMLSLNILNNVAPTYFTSFDDKTLFFDSYDSAVDDTLQSSKVQAYAYVIPDWEHTDNFIPDLPAEAFPYLVEEAKSRCALKLRQQADQKSEQSAQSNKRWLARKDWTVAGGIQFYNYGRNSQTHGGPNHRDPTFRRD